MPFNFRELKKGETVKCKYFGFYNDIGIYKKRIQTFHDNKKRFHIWGSWLLNRLMSDVPFGSYLELTYLGRGKYPDTKYIVHIYSVNVLKRGGKSKVVHRVEKDVTPALPVKIKRKRGNP
jgi:hypothetical protein